MLYRKFTNADALSYLHTFVETPDLKFKQGGELIKGLSFIPLSAAAKYRKFSNYKDLMQIGYETLWRAILTFDVSKSDNFFCWAFLWTRQKIAKEALKEKVYLNTFVSSGLDLELDELDEFEDLFLRAEEEDILKAAFSQLNKDQVFVMDELYKNDRSLRDVGTDMKVSHESVRRIRDDAIRILKRITDQKLVINT